jgi:mRNA interferase YafQ
MSSNKKGKQAPSKTSAKRVEPPLKNDYSSQFLKDWARIRDAGRQDLSRAKEGMKALLANEGPLPPEYKDHPLNGEWKSHREFHAGGDLLVIYFRNENSIVFERIGTHSELFG